MTTEPKRRFTPEEYLALERSAAYRSEYFDGEIFAMAGGTEAHNAIAVNIASELRSRLRAKPCRVYSSDMRLFVPVKGKSKFSYADVVVVCDAPTFQTDARDVLLNPKLIVEVLSEGTEGYDRGKKFEHYRRIESFSDYLLVAQDEAHVEHFVRQSSGLWALREATGLETTIALESLGCELPLSEIYLKIDEIAASAGDAT